MRLFFTLLITVSLRAEFLRIEQEFGTMDCASCAEFVQGKLTKNPAVESVKIDGKKGMLTVILKPGNKLKPSLIRDFVQQSGYQPKEVSVIAVGQAMMDRGRTKLKLSENETLIVNDAETRLRELINRRVQIYGKLAKVQSEGSMVDVLNLATVTQVQ